ncbi:hypothetical protein BH09ACT10_BH09ACT10_02550 [soil metagenome]
MTRIPARRLYAPTVLLTLAAGGAGFFASSRAWTSTKVEANGLPTDAIDITGTQAEPMLGALALVIVTAAIAILAAGTRVRRWVGILIVVAALVGLVLALTADPSTSSALSAAIQDSPAYTGKNAPDVFDSTWWQAATVFTFAVAAFLGTITAVYGPRWPTMGSRYDAPNKAKVVVVEDDSDIWKAMDAGEDPTL